jgi:asparagine synthase (glutamine-hydrolysing)
MCGIAGLWTFGGAGEDELAAEAWTMAGTLHHRGPDDEGVWVDAAAGVAFGFRRLSILDLSPMGAQPMTSASGRYVIVFNGEIYNHRRLRMELGSRDLRGRSDTEVLLACIDEWGLDATVERCIGMFAFALWDRGERRLSLVRDRLGVKPLYYRASHTGFSFASELKALGRADIDRGALALYMRYGYVPAPWSMFEGVNKLPPATILTVDPAGTMRMRSYWDAPRVAERAAANRFRGSEDDAVIELQSLLADSVRLRMISDVPLGLFLSGGLDSPLIAALMMREAGAVSTFTIGFEGMPSEAPAAAAVARHLGTNHTEEIISADDVLRAIPLIMTIYDEPLGDSSSVPTFLVSRLARKHVTVALSGDGGDELFGGYHRYFLGQRLTSRVARVPRRLRRPLSVALRAASMLPSPGNLDDRLRGFSSALTLDPIERFEQEVGSAMVEVLGAPARDFVLNKRDRWPELDDPVELMMYLDAVSYLPDDILAKVDRASMAVSLEVREPLLDHRVAELAWSLPLSMKVGESQGKRVLRRLVRKFVPEEIVDRDKQGFGLPIDGWLRGPLRDWAASLVDDARIRREGYFDPASVRRVWNDGPRPGAEGALWTLLMFQEWLTCTIRQP